MRPHRQQHFARGFTLVELLAVIAVVALLTLLAARALGTALEQARLTRCAAQLTNLGQALLLYAGDNGARLPPFAAADQTWDKQILPYADNATALLACPADPHLDVAPGQPPPRSYAVNGGQRYVLDLSYPFGSFDGQPPLHLSQLGSRSGPVILIGERPGESAANRGWFGEFPFSTLDQLPGLVHRKRAGCNYLFHNGSVRYLSAADASLSAENDYWYTPTP